MPGWIPPESEANVQKWLGEVKQYQGEFAEANQHVVLMDRATRVRDVQTENAECKAAAEILNGIKWKPYIPGQGQSTDTGNMLQASASVTDNSIVAAVRDALANVDLQNLATQIGSQIGPIASALDLANTFNEVAQFTKAYTTNPAAQQRMTQFFGQPSNQVLSQLASAEANHLINERPDILAAGLQHGLKTIRKGGIPSSGGTEPGGNHAVSSSKTPTGGGGNEPPERGGGNKTPTNSSGTEPPSGGGGAQPPPGGGSKPPSNGGDGSNSGGGGGGGKKPPANNDGGDGEDPHNLARLGKTTQESVQIKLETYLLNPDHRSKEGNLTGKAAFFKDALGFTKDNMSQLAKQIEFDPQTAVPTETTIYGNRFRQVITIQGANGQARDVPFIFQRGLDGVVRLITATDLPEKPKE
ncbi:MAG: hypothetical protein P4L53_16305 [Candidatus Obscuribacterales bacterium]|nr:hypothetical protein [Candidatus Obscuribacterales bacterium]